MCVYIYHSKIMHINVLYIYVSYDIYIYNLMYVIICHVCIQMYLSSQTRGRTGNPKIGKAKSKPISHETPNALLLLRHFCQAVM